MMTVQEAGKLGGSIKSDKKAKSSRENGKLGGRPKKVNPIEPHQALEERTAQST